MLLNVPTAPEMDSIREHIQGLEIESILAVPLMDGDEFAGILILEQCGAPRNWRPTDEVVLKTIAEQMILAVEQRPPAQPGEDAGHHRRALRAAEALVVHRRAAVGGEALPGAELHVLRSC